TMPTEGVSAGTKRTGFPNRAAGETPGCPTREFQDLGLRCGIGHDTLCRWTTGAIFMITLSVIKADTGGFVGHSAVHPDMMAEARRETERAQDSGLLVDGTVASCGDDSSLIMTHTYGCEAGLIHAFAWDTFQATTRIAKDLGLYGAGQDLLSEAFS